MPSTRSVEPTVQDPETAGQWEINGQGIPFVSAQGIFRQSTEMPRKERGTLALSNELVRCPSLLRCTRPISSHLGSGGGNTLAEGTPLGESVPGAHISA